MPFIVLFCLLCPAFADEPWQLDRPLPALKQGQDFRAALEQPISATWDQTPVRDVLRRLGETQQLGLLLDRRIDPTIAMQLTLTETPLIEGLARLAQPFAATAVPCGHTVYIGPVGSARWLRTTIAQRDAELEHAALSIPKARRAELLTRKTIHWSDFDTPREIVEQIAQRYQLSIEGVDNLPHDLWATATLTYATAPESLSLVLHQLDLDFRWKQGGLAIEIVPWQPPATIERRYPLKKSHDATQLWGQLRAAMPDIEGELAGNQLVIRGRIEEHEAVKAWLNPTARPKPPATAGLLGLTQRKFTLKVENVPIRQILAELEKTKVTLVYDAQELQDAGIDLAQPVTLDVTAVTAEEFLAAVLKPLPVRFEIEESTLRIFPEKP